MWSLLSKENFVKFSKNKFESTQAHINSNLSEDRYKKIIKVDKE